MRVGTDMRVRPRITLRSMRATSTRNPPAELILDVRPDDCVERGLRPEPQRRRAARVEILRPAGDDFCYHFVGLAADAAGDVGAGDPGESRNLLADGAAQARHGE